MMSQKFLKSTLFLVFVAVFVASVFAQDSEVEDAGQALVKCEVSAEALKPLGQFEIESDAQGLLDRLKLDADAQARVQTLRGELDFDNPDSVTDFGKHTALAIGGTAAKILTETPSSTLGEETLATLAELTRVHEAIAAIPPPPAPTGIRRWLAPFAKPAPPPTPVEALSTQSIFATLSKGAGVVVAEIALNEARRGKIRGLREELEAMVRKNQEVFAAAGLTYVDWIQNKLPEIEKKRLAQELDDGDYAEQIERIMELKRTLRQLFAMHLVLKQNLRLLGDSRRIAVTANQQLLNINSTVIPNIAQGASLSILGKEQLDLTQFIAGWSALASKVHLSNAQQAAKLQIETARNREATTVSQAVILQVYGLQAATLLAEFEIVKKAAADSATFEGQVITAMGTLQDTTARLAKEVLPISTNLTLLSVPSVVEENPLTLPGVSSGTGEAK